MSLTPGVAHSWCHSLGPPFISFAWLFASLLSLWPASKLPEGRHWACFLLCSARHISRTSTITCRYPSDKQMSKWIKVKLPDFNCQQSRAQQWLVEQEGTSTRWHKQPWVNLRKWFSILIKNTYFQPSPPSPKNIHFHLVPEKSWSHDHFHIRSFPLSFPN